MAGKPTTLPGTGILLVTANVGSLFEDPKNLQKTWLREFYQTVQSHKPHFLAVHCQEVGGKNYEASMSHVDSFVKELLSSDAMKEYSSARVYLDENYKSQEHFTALGSFYFIHESLKNIQQFDFKAKKFRKVVGKETCSETLETTPSLEKEKFPQDYFPECCMVMCAIIGKLSIEQSCADVVMKSTTARMSSPHSPLISQPCSNGRLSTYMQSRWNQPSLRSSPSFHVFHKV